MRLLEALGIFLQIIGLHRGIDGELGGRLGIEGNDQTNGTGQQGTGEEGTGQEGHRDSPTLGMNGSRHLVYTKSMNGPNDTPVTVS